MDHLSDARRRGDRATVLSGFQSVALSVVYWAALAVVVLIMLLTAFGHSFLIGFGLLVCLWVFRRTPGRILSRFRASAFNSGVLLGVLAGLSVGQCSPRDDPATVEDFSSASSGAESSTSDIHEVETNADGELWEAHEVAPALSEPYWEELYEDEDDYHGGRQGYSPNDQRSRMMNPQDDWGQEAMDNRSDQLNPNNDAYWQSRGYDERPDDWNRR